MKDLSLFRNKLLYGGDYNPDQWLDRTDILKNDVKLMVEAEVSVVSLGIFAWSTLEPTEGDFRFDWLDAILHNLHEADIKVFLATPSGAKPAWMARKYPEVLRVNSRGQRNLFGQRHNHCFSSPVYREKVRIINRKLAERYGKHPAVVLWHISNEYNGECHCELCQNNFRKWLKDKYQTLDALNKAWWNTFWSHTITDWKEINSPVPHGEDTVHGLNLDWKRFVTHMTVDFMRHEVKTLEAAGSELPVTTNMMATLEQAEFDPGLDYWKFRDVQDIASWDSYPNWHMPGYKAFDLRDYSGQDVDDYRRASEVAFQHDLYRNLNNGPFLLMESTPSKVNWRSMSKNKRPGMNILSSLHAVAHGANSVQYFQWRQSRGSFEKFHGAVVDQSGSANTRVFKEAAELGKILKALKEVAESEYEAKAAILFQWENRWAFEDSKDCVNDDRKAYIETFRKHYFCFWDAGVPLDVISGEGNLQKYELLIVPMLYMIDEVVAEKLKTFVETGGTLVTTYMTGYVNESDLCFEGGAPGPLKELLGILVEDVDSLHSAEMLTAGPEEPFHVKDYVEIIHPESAEVLSRFAEYPYESMPCLTVKQYGKGKAYHIAGRLAVEDLKKFYKKNLKDWNIQSNFRYVQSVREKVNIQIRTSKEREYLFLMNFDHIPAHVVLNEKFSDVLDHQQSGTEWHLDRYGVRILRRETTE